MRTLPQDQRPALLGGMGSAIRTLPESERLALAEETGTGTPQGFQMLYEVDREQALTTLATAPPETQWKLFAGLSNTLLETDPAAAASLFQSVMEQPVPDSAKDPATQAAEITVQWASHASEAAAAWAAQLPPGEAGTAAVQNAVSTWARFDYPAASAWAGVQPPGPVRDEAMKRLESLEQNVRI